MSDKDPAQQRFLGLTRGWRDAPDFMLLLGRRIIEDKALLNAAALTFTTLLALVPLTAVSVAIFAAFPIGDRVLEQLQAFIFENFVPAAGLTVQQYLEEFSAKAAKLTGPGFLFLLITSLMLVASIDRAFNDIWRVQRKRRTLSKFLVYWAIITLGPLLMGLSVALTSYLFSLPLLGAGSGEQTLASRLIQWTPWLASSTAFTLLYALVPQHRVPLVHALVGGVTAALLFELAKKGFVTYLSFFKAYEVIYGALSVIPIFLVWVYLAWLVTLLGAEITYCLGASRLGEGRRQGPLFRLVDVISVFSVLWERRQEGEGWRLEALAARVAMPGHDLERLLQALAERNWVFLSDAHEWRLGRDLDSVRLADLYNDLPLSLPKKAEIDQFALSGFDGFVQWFSTADRELEKVMDVPLRDVLVSAG